LPSTQVLAVTVAVPLWSCTAADTTWPPSRVASVIVLWKKTSTPDAWQPRRAAFDRLRIVKGRDTTETHLFHDTSDGPQFG